MQGLLLKKQKKSASTVKSSFLCSCWWHKEIAFSRTPSVSALTLPSVIWPGSGLTSHIYHFSGGLICFQTRSVWLPNCSVCTAIAMLFILVKSSSPVSRCFEHSGMVRFLHLFCKCSPPRHVVYSLLSMCLLQCLHCTDEAHIGRNIAPCLQYTISLCHWQCLLHKKKNLSSKESALQKVLWKSYENSYRVCSTNQLVSQQLCAPFGSRHARYFDPEQNTELGAAIAQKAQSHLEDKTAWYWRRTWANAGRFSPDGC